MSKGLATHIRDYALEDDADQQPITVEEIRTRRLQTVS